MGCFLWFKHKVKYKKGQGFKCVRCGKTLKMIFEEKNNK